MVLGLVPSCPDHKHQAPRSRAPSSGASPLPADGERNRVSQGVKKPCEFIEAPSRVRLTIALKSLPNRRTGQASNRDDGVS